MARGSGLPEDIYDAIVARLIDRIPGICTEANCFQSLNPDSVPPNPGDLVFIVSPMSGRGLESYFEGGGEQQLTIEGGVTVKIHSPLQLDQKGHDIHLLADASRGLWKISRKVLACLANSAWSPMKGDDEITRDPMIFLGFDITKNSRKRKTLGAIELHFKVTFDWDITTPEEDL